MKYNLSVKVEKGEESLNNGVECGPVTMGRAAVFLNGGRYEPAGRSVTRIAGQMGNLNEEILNELRVAVRGGWGFPCAK